METRDNMLTPRLRGSARTIPPKTALDLRLEPETTDLARHLYWRTPSGTPSLSMHLFLFYRLDNGDFTGQNIETRDDIVNTPPPGAARTMED